MSYTLDELLDATGVSDLSDDNLTKKAAATHGENLSKLAERCRQAVNATPDEHALAHEQELVEKTASVAVISRTLAEIQAIDATSPGATKTAGPQVDHAIFIKAALEAGHGPKEIAELLEKNAGLMGRLMRRGKETLLSRKTVRGVSKYEKVISQGEKDTRTWSQLIRSAPEAEKAGIISRMRKNLGDQRALNIISATSGHGMKNVAEFKALQKAVPAGASGGLGAAAAAAKGPAHAASVNVGGTTLGITSKQLKAAKKPAMYAGAGLLASKALGGGGEKKRPGGSGPIIITR